MNFKKFQEKVSKLLRKTKNTAAQRLCCYFKSFRACARAWESFRSTTKHAADGAAISTLKIIISEVSKTHVVGSSMIPHVALTYILATIITEFRLYPHSFSLSVCVSSELPSFSVSNFYSQFLKSGTLLSNSFLDSSNVSLLYYPVQVDLSVNLSTQKGVQSHLSY